VSKNKEEQGEIDLDILATIRAFLYSFIMKVD